MADVSHGFREPARSKSKPFVAAQDSARPHRSIRLLRMMALPHVAVLAGVGISAMAWAMPAISSVGKGFVASPPTANELARTFGAYAMIATLTAIGYLLGIIFSRRLPDLSDQRASDLRRNEVWTCSIIVAAIGVTIVNLVIIRAMGVSGCISALTTFNANAFKIALYEDYIPGVLSFRYVAIFAGSIAIFRYLAFKEISVRTFASLGLLLCVAVISSRLSLIWAVVMGGTAYLLYPDHRAKRVIGRGEVFSGMAIILVVLGTLTISRTYGYYRERGAESMVSAIGSEFQRYLAAPFQGSIESVNNPNQRSRLRTTSGIDVELSTNSAFMDFAVLIGRWNLIGLGLTLAASGMVCGILRRYSGTYLILGFGVLQGCHLEVWRIAMFHRGITMTLFAFAIIVPLLLNAFQLPKVNLPRVRLRL